MSSFSLAHCDIWYPSRNRNVIPSGF